MAKQEKEQVNKGASKVASTIAKVFDTVSKQGNIITQCVTSVKAVYRGADVPVTDERFIADNVARIRGWSAASASARKSEVRKIVRNYLTIPEAVEMYVKKHGGLSWHQAMQLATQLNKGLTCRQAVLAMTTKAEVPKVAAPKQIAALLTRISNIETRSSKIIAFRKDLSALVSKHGL